MLEEYRTRIAELKTRVDTVQVAAFDSVSQLKDKLEEALSSVAAWMWETMYHDKGGETARMQDFAAETRSYLDPQNERADLESQYKLEIKEV